MAEYSEAVTKLSDEIADVIAHKVVTGDHDDVLMALVRSLVATITWLSDDDDEARENLSRMVKYAGETLEYNLNKKGAH